MTIQLPSSGVILSIGMHKTGSTSLQKALDDYDDGHTFCPNLGSRPNQSFALLGRYEGLFAHQTINDPTYSAEAIETQISNIVQKSRERQRVILVAEAGGTMKLESQRLLLTDLVRCYESVLVHMYAREPIYWAGSFFSQCISQGAKKPTPKMLAVEYTRRLQFWLKQLGQGHVSVSDYHQSSLSHGSIVSHFCSLLEIDGTHLFNAQALKSPSFPCLRLLATFNRLCPIKDPRARAVARYRMKRILAEAYASEPKINPQDLSGAVECSAEEVEYLAQWGISYTACHSNQKKQDRFHQKFIDVSDISMCPLLETMNKMKIALPRRKTPEDLLLKLCSFVSARNASVGT